MILNITVQNFRSIREKQTLDLVRTGLKGHDNNVVEIFGLKLLRTCAIYGSNASGKSNFLKAAKALEYMVLYSSNYASGDKIEAYEPFRLSNDTLSAPVLIAIEFIAPDNIRYSYSVSFSSERIEQESLHYNPKGQWAKLFVRDVNKSLSYGETYRGERKSIEKKLNENQLFLSKAVLDNVESAQQAYMFFKKKLNVYPFITDYHESHLSNLYAQRLAENNNSSFARKFNKLICALDTGISSVKSENRDWSKTRLPSSMPDDVKKQLQEEYKYNIKTVHKSADGISEDDTVLFDISDESVGTQSLFVLGGIVLDVLNDGNVLIVDEFEKNLHPHITRFLIQLFHNPQVNKKNAQLILATHDVAQLDEEIFRRDQVWLTERNEFGASSLTRCSDIKGLRLGTPLNKWYYSGRLGGTPIINELDLLLEFEQDEQ
jgi:AAA15 family ATPase/GTPase